ncbi:putative starch synthase [Helianthus anomalus]
MWFQVFVDHPCYRRPGNLYGDTYGAFGDNQFRFTLLCHATCEAPLVLPLGGFTYGQNCLFLANDWHAGLVPVCLVFFVVSRVPCSTRSSPKPPKLRLIHLLAPKSYLKHKHRSYLIQDNYTTKWRIILCFNMLKGCPKDHPSPNTSFDIHQKCHSPSLANSIHLSKYHPHGIYKDARSIIVIHNIAHQGVEAASTYCNLGLPWEWYGALEWIFPTWARTHALDTGQAVNILKGAIVTANRILTFSEGYAWKITTPEAGYGLHGLLTSRKFVVNGITNGIDITEWDPSSYEHISSHYTADDLSGKVVIVGLLAT